MASASHIVHPCSNVARQLRDEECRIVTCGCKRQVQHHPSPWLQLEMAVAGARFLGTHTHIHGPQEQLIGSKALTVQLIMERMPESVLTTLIDHVSVHGWTRAMISEDSLASKRIQSV
jgi:hypothetical protein